MQSDVEEYLPETLSGIDFYGFKVLQLKQEKDTAWMKAYKDIAQAFVKFIKDNKEDVTAWKGKQPNAVEFFNSQLGKSEEKYRNPDASQSASQKDDVKAQANALFAEIQKKSLESQSQFKHVEKNAHKKNPDSAQPIPQPKAPVARPAPAKAEVKKEPKKDFVNNTYYIVRK